MLTTMTVRMLRLPPSLFCFSSLCLLCLRNATKPILWAKPASAGQLYSAMKNTTISLCRAVALFLFLGIGPATVFHAQAQADFLIKGKVIEKNDQSPIPLVNIYNVADGNGTTSTMDGSFEINVRTLPTSLRFSFIGFETKSISIAAKSEAAITVALQRSTSNLPEIVVVSEAKVVELTKPEFNVKDFVILDESILLLKSADSRSPYILTLTDIEGNVEQELTLAGMKKLESLHRGCLGEAYIVADKAYEVFFEKDGSMSLLEGIPLDKFNTIVIPCVLATDSQVYYMHSYYEGQLVEFAMFHRSTKSKSILYRVIDEKNIKLLYSDFLLNDGGFADVAIEDWRSMRSFRNAQADRLATINMFYQPLYTPLVNTGNELCFFDHFEKKAAFFKYDGKYQRSLPLHHQKDKKWAKNVLNDSRSHKSYLLFGHASGKALQEFNYEDGSLGNPIVVETDFVAKMAVHGGYFFFLESGNGGDGKNVNKKLRKLRIAPF